MQSSSTKNESPTLNREDVLDWLSDYISRELTAGGTGIDIDPADLIYCSWPQLFGSTCGPFPGIGGCAMTTFRMEAWVWNQWAVVFCGGRVVSIGEFQIEARYPRQSVAITT